jgi:hypothetical protein
MMPLPPTADERLSALLARALAGEDLVQVFFRAEVLDRYREPAYRILRSDSAGRLMKVGGFGLDFGIAPGESLIHVSLKDLRARLPEGERAHWLAFAVSLPYSRNFLEMQLRPGSCFDDGEIRKWERT